LKTFLRFRRGDTNYKPTQPKKNFDDCKPLSKKRINMSTLTAQPAQPAATGFQATMFVSDQLSRQLVNASQDLALRCIQHCASKYGFNAEEVITDLGLLHTRLERKTPRVRAAPEPKAAFPLPYNGEFQETMCFALRHNHGLYTQCRSLRKDDAEYCARCTTQMQKTGGTEPEYGTIQKRQNSDIMFYIDPKGRMPIRYGKIMKKYNLTEEMVREEAAKFGMTVLETHFEPFVPSASVGNKRKRNLEEGVQDKAEEADDAEETEEEPKGKKGRPKKSPLLVEIDNADIQDLFSSLVDEDEMIPDIMPATLKAASDSSAEEKEAKRVAKAKKEQERRAKAKAEAKAAAEAQKALEEAAAAEQQKALEEAAAAEQQKGLEEAAAAEQQKALEEAAKEQKILEKKAEEAKAMEDPEADVIKKITVDGKKYLRSKKTGIIYDYDVYIHTKTQKAIGKWSQALKRIVFDKEADSSSSESDNEEVEELYD
jgi:hypothetical protein